MFRLLWICALLSLTAWLGLRMHQETGLVVLAFEHTTIELPLWLAVVATLIGFGIFYLLIRMVKFIFWWLSWWRKRSNVKRRRKSLSLTNQGMIELAEGDWLHAERNLIRGAFESELPVLNYLGAAEAAQSQGAHQRRDKYLKLASKTKGSELAVGLKAAEFELNHGQLDQCLTRLQDLKRIAPRHPAVLNMLKRLYAAKQDWANLLSLLPQLKKHGGCEAVEYSDLERQAYSSMLNAARLSQNGEQLTEAWKNFPSLYHHDPYFVSVYVEGLVSHRQYDLAEKTLRHAINQQWQIAWVRLYGVIAHLHPARSLSVAEGWIKQHADCAALFLTLGRLAVMGQLWTKAERYLEVSLTLLPDSEAYVELGRLYEKLERPEQSNECYRKGLLLVASAESLGRGIAPMIPSSVNEKLTG
jgi:HemY protein